MIRGLRRGSRAATPGPLPPERAAELSRTPHDLSFITGNGIAACCRYVLNYGEPAVNEAVDNDWWFCKADYLEHFFRELAPRDDYVLFSHNSDRAIGRRFLRELRRPRLVAWFAQNPLVRHPKLHSLPIGIANPHWPHGDQAVFERLQASPPAKSRLFDVSFDVATNPPERRACIAATHLEPAPRRPFPEYVAGLAASFFCISPSGNGIDGHRTWEALYLRSVPVVTRSLVTEHHPDLPLIVLDSWSDFGSIEFSERLYADTWAGWDPASIRLDRYLERVESTISRLRRR